MQDEHPRHQNGLPDSAIKDCLGYVDKDVEHYYTG